MSTETILPRAAKYRHIMMVSDVGTELWWPDCQDAVGSPMDFLRRATACLTSYYTGNVSARQAVAEMNHYLQRVHDRLTRGGLVVVPAPPVVTVEHLADEAGLTVVLGEVRRLSGVLKALREIVSSQC